MGGQGSRELRALLGGILVDDPRYDVEAYSFVLDAVDFTLRKLKMPRHVTASELLEGIRNFAIKSFGPMTKTVLENWGIRSCEDFGEIVFHLVSLGLMSKRDSDSKADFKGGYDFQEAFEKPFWV